MAVRSMMVVYVVLLLALLSVVDEASIAGLFVESGNGCPCILAEAAPVKNQIRKLLHGTEEVFKAFGSLDSRHGKDMLGWDLREVPSGPDPLHHNGGGSKQKPHTP